MSELLPVFVGEGDAIVAEEVRDEEGLEIFFPFGSPRALYWYFETVIMP